MSTPITKCSSGRILDWNTQGAEEVISVSKGLDMVKNTRQDDVPQAIPPMLEKKFNELWQRIQERPETYVMNNEEFALFNYYRNRLERSNLAQRAVARFWVDQERKMRSRTDTESQETTSKDSWVGSPPGFLAPEQGSKKWQDDLEEYCLAARLPSPSYNVLSDRRGKRIAWFCTVLVGGHCVPARYWYQYVSTAKEDAAGMALVRLSRTLQDHHQKASQRWEWMDKPVEVENGSDNIGSSNEYFATTSEDGPAPTGTRTRLQTMLGRDVGEAFVLAPTAIIHSGNENPENVSPGAEEVAGTTEGLPSVSRQDKGIQSGRGKGIPVGSSLESIERSPNINVESDQFSPPDTFGQSRREESGIALDENDQVMIPQPREREVKHESDNSAAFSIESQTIDSGTPNSQQIIKSGLDSTSTHTHNREPVRKWVPLCADQWDRTRRFISIDITSCKSDEDFFREMRNLYTYIRPYTFLRALFVIPIGFCCVQLCIDNGGLLTSAKEDVFEKHQNEFPPILPFVINGQMSHLFELSGPSKGAHYLDNVPKILSQYPPQSAMEPEISQPCIELAVEIVEGLDIRANALATVLFWTAVLLIGISRIKAKDGFTDGQAIFTIFVFLWIPFPFIMSPQLRRDRDQTLVKRAFSITSTAMNNMDDMFGYYWSKLPTITAPESSMPRFDDSSEIGEGVFLAYGEEHGIVNAIKIALEEFTGVVWDWWPLHPSLRQLKPDQRRVWWICHRGHAHRSVVLLKDVLVLREILDKQATNSPILPPTNVLSTPPSVPDTGSSDSSNYYSGETADSRSSESPLSSVNSVDDSSNEDSNQGGSDSGGNTTIPQDDVALDIVAPHKLKGFVLFGVLGSKRLRSVRTRMAQIDVTQHKDDDSFFDEMRLQYRKLRGSLRWFFSIWQFHDCDFVVFHKMNPNEILAGKEELPRRDNRDYYFDADRIPPVCGFRDKFYGCKAVCTKAQLDIFELLHECRGRNYCGMYRVLTRLPKRLRKWQVQINGGKEEAWGLNATFIPSAFKVLIYHLVIFLGPTVSWVLWMKKWPKDLQDASVPFLAAIGLCSLFWALFATFNGHGIKRKED